MLPVVYINLDRDVQRRQAMETMLRRHGLSFERLPAVVWADLDESSRTRLYAPALNRRQFDRPLADGEKGCYASHLKACEHLLACDAAAMVVLEDDVELTEAFADVVAAIESLPPQGWDLIKFHSRPRERPARAVPLTASHSLVAYRRVPSMSNGYALSRAGAAKLLQHRRPFGRPVDVDVRYWWEVGLRVLGVVPSIVGEGAAASASSIWRDVRPHRSWGGRWRRLRLQVAYTWCNAWYAARVDPLQAVMVAAGATKPARDPRQ